MIVSQQNILFSSQNRTGPGDDTAAVCGRPGLRSWARGGDFLQASNCPTTDRNARFGLKPNTTLTAPDMSRAKWIVLALLVAVIFISNIDRTNLSVGATDIQKDLGLNNYDLGILLSSFFWTYAAFQLFVIAGWLVDRFHVGWVLAAGVLLWSGATGASGFATGFGALLTFRLLLGVGESVAVPSCSKILATHFPEHRRGLANALIEAGCKLGPALGTLLGGFLMAEYGWRPFFIILGLGSLLWLVPWVIFMPKGPGAGTRIATTEGPTVTDVLRQRSAWGTFLGLFCANYFWYFLVTWLPAYLETERGFSKTRMGVFGALAFLVAAVAAVAAGWLSDHWITRGAAPTRVRKAITGLGLAGAIVILPVASVRDEQTALVLLMLACVSYGAFSSNHWAITQTIAGPLAVGKWAGLQNGVGNLAGVAAPWITGWVIHQTGHFYLAFVVTAIVVLIGSANYLFVIGPVRPCEFRKRRAA